MKKFLEAGKIVNIHGVRGEMKVQPWSDTPSFLCGFQTVYIDGKAYPVRAARVQGTCVLLSLAGVNDDAAASSLKNRTVCIDREDCALPEGRYFVQDLVGLDVLDADTGRHLGKLADVLDLPGQNVYVVRGDREILIPANPAFLVETNLDAGFIRVRLIEGM